MKDNSQLTPLPDLNKLSVRDIIPDLGRINEDRTINRTSAEIVQNLGKKSFAQEIENDKQKSAAYINRATDVANQLGKDNPIAKQEKQAIDVYKRALLLMGSGDLQVIDKDGKKAAADNNMPTASILGHGGRAMIEIPAGSGDRLMNWLSSGDPATDGRSRKQTQQGAIADNKTLYNRPAATHDVSIEADGKGGFDLKEKKGFSIGLRDFLSNKLLGKKTNHFGVDLALNAEYGKKDSEGKIVDKPDGDHGHLYVHYIPPTKDKPGSLMIGIEGAAPSSPKHSKTGASDPVSPTGGTKFDELAIKQQLSTESEYKDTKVPQKYGGMQIKLSDRSLDEITKLKADNFGTTLAYSVPGKSAENFQEKLNNKDYHQTPEFKESKDTDSKAQLPKAPALVKSIANIAVKTATLGIFKPFKKEIEEYKAETTKYKIDSKLATVKSKIDQGKEVRKTNNSNPLFKNSQNTNQHSAEPTVNVEKKTQLSTEIRTALNKPHKSPHVSSSPVIIGSHRRPPQKQTGRG
ncbi:MAG: hypothetical protein EOP33_02195 [Rickettsiaceae bacterium]|nr:MAG: hypothetical protein EOP33_02195 [Rickettsiaceae bacterium]